MIIPWKPEYAGVVAGIEERKVGRGHRYYVPGYAELLTSVTTHLNSLAKGGFINWARGDSLDHAKALLLEGDPRNLPGEDCYPGYLDEVMEQAKAPPSDKADLGSWTHDVICGLIRGEYEGTLFAEIPPAYHMQVRDSVRVAFDHLASLNIEVKNCVPEQAVFSPMWLFAGRIDLTYVSPRGGLGIIDWKRAKGVWPENHFQLGAYGSGLGELIEEGVPIEAWACLLPSEPGIQPVRRDIDIEARMGGYLAAKSAYEELAMVPRK